MDEVAKVSDSPFFTFRDKHLFPFPCSGRLGFVVAFRFAPHPGVRNGD